MRCASHARFWPTHSDILTDKVCKHWVFLRSSSPIGANSGQSDRPLRLRRGFRLTGTDSHVWNVRHPPERGKQRPPHGSPHWLRAHRLLSFLATGIVRRIPGYWDSSRHWDTLLAVGQTSGKTDIAWLHGSAGVENSRAWLLDDTWRRFYRRHAQVDTCGTIATDENMLEVNPLGVVEETVSLCLARSKLRTQRHL